jgi:hypothetical protein
MGNVTSREKQRARAIAEEYRSKGYEVIEEPSPAQLPDFLASYHPDMLAQRGDEAIIRVHPDLWYPVPPMNGGHSHGEFTVHRASAPPDRGTRFDQSHPR